jgi:transposase
MRKAQPNNFNRAEYQFLSEMILEPKAGSRKFEVYIWEFLNAIFYVHIEGVRWRKSSGEFPVWQTVNTYFRNWHKEGILRRTHGNLQQWTWIEQERNPRPSEVIIDSQSVKTGVMVHQAVGYDAENQELQAIYNSQYPGSTKISFCTVPKNSSIHHYLFVGGCNPFRSTDITNQSQV